MCRQWGFNIDVNVRNFPSTIELRLRITSSRFRVSFRDYILLPDLNIITKEMPPGAPHCPFVKKHPILKKKRLNLVAFFSRWASFRDYFCKL